ncbi:MAG: hypothetical protein GXP29_10065 [Planctomycetes bacterium]|nr:hypothetical protein [Planctomycetota bacterium]
MPVGKEPKLGLLLDAIREGVPAAKAKFGEWCETCREEPTLIWQTPAIRYVTYAVVGLVGVLTVSAVANSCVPNIDVQERATTTDHRVMCTNTDCANTFVVDRPFGFDDFPVTCPKCSKQTGERSVRCNSETCKGRWIVRDRRGDRFVCPHCETDLGPAD